MFGRRNSCDRRLLFPIKFLFSISHLRILPWIRGENLKYVMFSIYKYGSETTRNLR